jgi:AAHS family 4-hydroxybenzoate transporter-like MFS transporter
MPLQDAAGIQPSLEGRLSRYQWLIFGLCFAVVLLDGFDTAAIGYLAPSLMAEWGIQKPQLGPVLSAALAGLTCGSLTAGPLADRYGRKRPIVAAVLVFGLASVGAAHAASLAQLTAWRFVTGIGLGAAMPNAVTLMSEYCPTARRATLTNAMFCGFPLGAAVGGAIAAWMLPRWGWHSVLLAGGILPLVLAAALLSWLPESLRFMVAGNWPASRIRKVLDRIGEAALDRIGPAAPRPGTDADTDTDAGAGLALALSPRYRLGTVMLWLTYFMGLVIFYSLVNWMPVLFKEAGLAPREATLVAALFPLGGVGAVAFGWLMDRYDGDRIIAAGFALTALAVFAVGRVADHLGLLVLAVLAAGTLMNTAQSSLPALAAGFYPTACRATGVAWMLGIGRLGGIAGSFIVAQMTALQFGFSAILNFLALPGLLAAAFLLAKRSFQRKQRSGPAA